MLDIKLVFFNVFSLLHTKSKLEPRLDNEQIHDVVTIAMKSVYMVTNTVPLAVGKPKTEVRRLYCMAFHVL